jgi:transposase
MSLNEARQALRVSRNALLHIVEYWVNKAVTEDELSETKQLSLDETSFKRGQSYVTIVGEPVKRRVIGVEEGRGIDAVERFSMDFESRGGNCERVAEISMDMSKTYRAAVDLCFPRASVIFDHFHVKKLVLDAMDRVRQEEQGKTYARSRQAG